MCILHSCDSNSHSEELIPVDTVVNVQKDSISIGNNASKESTQDYTTAENNNFSSEAYLALKEILSISEINSISGNCQVGNAIGESNMMFYLDSSNRNSPQIVVDYSA